GWPRGRAIDRTARAVGLRGPHRSALRIRDTADRHQRRIGARRSGWRWWGGGSGRRGRGCHGTGGSADDRAGCRDREPLTLVPVFVLVRLLAAGLRAGARLLPGRLVLPCRPLGRGPDIWRARSTSARASLSALRRRRARPRREAAAGGWALAREPSRSEEHTSE